MADLNVNIGIEDAAITAIVVGLIGSVLGILLKDKIRNSEIHKYKVMPIYRNLNILHIEFNGIFAISMRNTINMILRNIDKGRVKKDVRTSNRRTYAYSDE